MTRPFHYWWRPVPLHQSRHSPLCAACWRLRLRHYRCGIVLHPRRHG